ncbi:S-acyltransferase [Citrus sinensis]|uniref:S-acyltransferase n=1 Tax=Citrus sinensis TaxID=2711 RepID=A0ACB8IMA0_CITSI|nr:S-acyltransferase [Citrus sinensis]
MYANPRPPQLSHSNRRIIDSNSETLRLYEVWKGTNFVLSSVKRFCCGGRLIFGPDVRSIFLTLFLIVTPVILFCVFVSQTLIDEFRQNRGNLIVAICVVFTLYVIFLLLLTSGRDPGIIPRNLHPPELEDDGSTISTDWLGSQNGGGGPTLPPTRDVVVNGMVVKVKYCHTCMLYRPPRCSHCSICNNCVERFDHHCPWVGQCIGKTTYENFRYRYHRKMNPYNRGCGRNFVEIFFSKIPSSRNNFRAKVKVDSSSIFATPMSFVHSRRPEVPKRSFDIEMGKRQAVAAEDFDDIQSQLGSVGGLERSATQPRRTNWDHKANWQNTPDMHMLAAEYGIEHGLTDREKHRGDH